MLECTNDSFTIDQRILFARFNIKVPVVGNMYSIRKKLITQNGPAYLLNEIINPKIPNENSGPEGEDYCFEVSWATFRFSILDLPEVEQEELDYT